MMRRMWLLCGKRLAMIFFCVWMQISPMMWGTAIEVGRRMEAYDLFWFEEPISRDDVAGYVEIKRALGMRIAGCEGLQGRWAFREFIQRRAVDIVQPDIAIVGGFTEARKGRGDGEC